MGLLDNIKSWKDERRAKYDARRGPAAELPKEYRSKVKQLPSSTQDEVERFQQIFSNDLTPVLNFIDEIYSEGKTDYFKNSKKVKEETHPDDLIKYLDYNTVGKIQYDLMYRKDSEGAKRAQRQVLDNKAVQLAGGVTSGIWNTVAGIGEMGAALTDLALDTDTLSVVEKALPAIDMYDIYGDRRGSIAKFTNILTQYGLGFGVARKIATKVITKAAKTKLGKNAAAKAAAISVTKNKTALDFAKYGGYWMLPAGLGDAMVSNQANISMGDAFGDPNARGGFFSPLQRALANSKTESLDGLTGKERAAAVLRNKLKFGVEGTMIVGGLPLVGTSIKTAAKVTGKGLTIADKVAIQPGVKLLAKGADKVGLNTFAKNVDQARKNLGTKLGIPKYEYWKFSETAGSNLAGKLRGYTEAIGARFASNFKFDKASANARRTMDNQIRRSKKFTDLNLTELDREMYGLVKAGFKDRLFTTQTTVKAMKYWDDVLKYMKGQKKLGDLPKPLQQASWRIRKTIDAQTKALQPLVRDADIKEELISNMGKYLHTSYEIFKNSAWRAPEKTRQAAIKWYGNLLRKNYPNKSPEDIRRMSELKINELLSIGRAEGTTPQGRIKDIANAANEYRIPANIFKDVKNLPDELSKLFGKVEDPKNIILDTIVEQAHTLHSYRAYKDMKNMGLGKWLFRNQEEYLDFVQKNKINNPRPVVNIKVTKPYNMDIEDLFVSSVKGPKGKTVKAPMVALPEMAKAITDTSVMMDGLLKFPMIKSLLGIKAATQINKTVLSVMTQMRNITTASLFALANGHIGVGASVSDDFDLLFKELIGKTKDPKKLRDAIDEALEAGALDSSTIATELEKMIPELMGPSKFNITKGGKTSFEGKTSDQIMAWMFTKDGAMGKAIQKSIEAYQLGDNVWKMYGYNFTKSQLKPAFKNINDVKRYFREVEGYEWNPLKPGAQAGSRVKADYKTVEDAIKEVSGLIVRDTYPNYSMVPRFVQNVRKIPIMGNFVGFTSEMWRNSYQISRRGLKELQSTNPYIRQMGARRLMGFGTTLFALGPVASNVAEKLVGVTQDKITAWKESFAPVYQKGHRMIPIGAQDKITKDIPAIDFDAQNPYTDVQKPFKVLMETVNKGPQTDETVLGPWIRGMFEAIKKAGEPFFSPAIWAQTIADVMPNKNLVSTAKSGRVIADWKNDSDPWGKVMYHIYSTAFPTTIKSGEKLFRGLMGQVTKHAVEIDPQEESAAILAGVRVVHMDGYKGMKFKVNQLAGDMGRADRTFIRNTVDANKLQGDAALIADGMLPEYIPQKFNEYIENRYRVWSEAYKDVKNLRTLGYTEKEIEETMVDRQPFGSKKNVKLLMRGYFNPPNDPFKRAGFENIVDTLNRSNANRNNQEGTTLKDDYRVKDFLNRSQLKGIARNWKYIPLGLDEAGQEEMLRLPTKSKVPLYKEDLQEQIDLKKQQIQEERDNQSFLPTAPIGTPELNFKNFTASRTSPTFSGNIDQSTGLTGTQTALLSPEEQEIAKRQNQGIGSLA